MSFGRGAGGGHGRHPKPLACAAGHGGPAARSSRRCLARCVRAPATRTRPAAQCSRGTDVLALPRALAPPPSAGWPAACTIGHDSRMEAPGSQEVPQPQPQLNQHQTSAAVPTAKTQAGAAAEMLPRQRSAADDDASLRGISLEFLVEFTWEHSAWHMSTYEVVEIIKAATAHTRKPYTHLLAPEQIGSPTIFLSHAWQNDFGLVVATARKYVSNEQQRLAGKGGGSGGAVFVWLDIFAITQHSGETQAHDLSRLEATIKHPECTTLVVLDEEGIPLTRCWCIFEFFATLRYANGRHGKLQVRAGALASGGTGEYMPCVDPERLVKLAESVDAMSAEASVPADKAVILSRLEELVYAWDEEGVATKKSGRDGTHELNRKLARAVRRGW